MWLCYQKSPGLSKACLLSHFSMWPSHCSVWAQSPVWSHFSGSHCSHVFLAPYLNPHWGSSKAFPHPSSCQPWAVILLLAVNDLTSSLEVLICLIWIASCIFIFLPQPPVLIGGPPFVSQSPVIDPSTFSVLLRFWLYPSSPEILHLFHFIAWPSCHLHCFLLLSFTSLLIEPLLPPPILLSSFDIHFCLLYFMDSFFPKSVITSKSLNPSSVLGFILLDCLL